MKRIYEIAFLPGSRPGHANLLIGTAKAVRLSDAGVPAKDLNEFVSEY